MGQMQICLCKICVTNYACLLLIAHIVARRFVLSGCLDGIGQKAEDGASPQQDGESTEQLAAELDPLRSGGRRGESIGTISDQKLGRLGIGQSLQGTERKWVLE